MPSFVKGPNYFQPFGSHNFLRSTADIKTESRTVAASTVPTETIDGFAQKILLKGEVLALVTSGVEAGKVGPYQPGTPADDVQTLTRTSTGGTVTLTFKAATTAAIPATAAGFTADAVETALLALTTLSPGDITVTGAAGGPIVVTFVGRTFAGDNTGAITVDNTSATGGTVTVAHTTTGSAGTGGATDGRENPDNIVGLNNTFLPWQLLDRDVEVACVYEAAAYQARCSERDAAGARQSLSDATAAAMVARKGVSILFK